VSPLLAQNDAPLRPLPGIDGFLGTRGSFMLDVVFLAMFAIVPLLGLSIYFVKCRRRYGLHKRMQLLLGTVLLIAVAGFEIDMQLLTDWQQRAAGSPYFDAATPWTCPAGISLLVHLFFAIPTALLWIYVIAGALRRFPRPAAPSPYSRHHLFWARLAAFEMLMTALTGWTFYWLAFVR
jgi:hypothetical protein